MLEAALLIAASGADEDPGGVQRGDAAPSARVGCWLMQQDLLHWVHKGQLARGGVHPQRVLAIPALLDRIAEVGGLNMAAGLRPDLAVKGPEDQCSGDPAKPAATRVSPDPHQGVGSLGT